MVIISHSDLAYVFMCVCMCVWIPAHGSLRSFLGRGWWGHTPFHCPCIQFYKHSHSADGETVRWEIEQPDSWLITSYFCKYNGEFSYLQLLHNVVSIYTSDLWLVLPQDLYWASIPEYKNQNMELKIHNEHSSKFILSQILSTDLSGSDVVTVRVGAAASSTLQQTVVDLHTHSAITRPALSTHTWSITWTCIHTLSLQKKRMCHKDKNTALNIKELIFMITEGEKLNKITHIK